MNNKNGKAMKLEEMTKKQLLNIILRKDDVENRLRAEIESLKQKNHRLEKERWTGAIGTCLLFAVICISSVSLMSFNIIRPHQQDGHAMVATSIDGSQSQETERVTTQDWGYDAVFDTIYFFGKPIVMDDRTSIHHQIRTIALSDSMLTYKTDGDKQVLTVGEVGFGVNIHRDNSIVLISSTQIDDPRIIPIVKYLNGLYGEAYENEDDNYQWQAYKYQSNKRHNVQSIKLRPLRGSEEGGSVIIFY